MASCDLCGRHESKSVRLVEGEDKHKLYMICLDCSADLMLQRHPEALVKPKTFSETVGYTTKDIYTKLGLNVRGQDTARKTLAIALVNHMKRLTSSKKLDKSNVLLIGSTGTGKTLLVKELAEITSLPLGMADATTLTQTGWSGEDPETVLLDLYAASGKDVRKMERGIVFIDEIDKLALGSDSHTSSSSGVQRGLLKILEGSTVSLSLGRNPYAESNRITVNTRNILFICAGSFNGLSDIVNKRLNNTSIGFGGKVDKLEGNDRLKDVTTEDLESFGLISEFIGRIPSKTVLDDLTEVDLREILTHGEDSIVKQMEHLFFMDGTRLHFSSTGLEEIARQAFKLKTGARGLKSIVDKVLFDFQFECKESSVVITSQIVRDKMGETEELHVKYQRNIQL